MLTFHERRRAVLVEKLPDLANVAAGALIFGQLFGSQDLLLVTVLAGVAIWLVLMFLVMLLVGSE